MTTKMARQENQVVIGSGIFIPTLEKYLFVELNLFVETVC